MTQEEKARAYDEAIEKAKELMKKGYFVLMLEIFPELTESEDEKIRKEMLSFIESVQHSYLCATDRREKWIAYLEKQKEPAPIPDKFSGLKSLMLQYLQSAANREDDTEIENDMDLWGRKILDYVWKCGEKQKEQKPAGWSEEDEKRLIKTTIAFLKDFTDKGYENAVECIDWLKSLRPDSYKNCNSRWKPSGEQMGALQRAVNKLAKTDVSDSVRLSIMYDNLKKLM